MDVSAYIEAGKLPRSLLPWRKGGKMNACEHNGDAFLFDVNIGSLHRVDSAGEGFGGYTVMDDSDRELRRHLQAVKAATGRVLKTGLGFGCFVRMALLKPEVEHIDVIEIDQHIASHFGAQFADDRRVTIHVADAFDFEPTGRRWDFGWHDIYCECNDGLAELHTKLICKFMPHCDLQGAWQLPREARRCSAVI